jgi:hypothetical protein
MRQLTPVLKSNYHTGIWKHFIDPRIRHFRDNNRPDIRFQDVGWNIGVMFYVDRSVHLVLVINKYNNGKAQLNSGTLAIRGIEATKNFINTTRRIGAAGVDFFSDTSTP